MNAVSGDHFKVNKVKSRLLFLFSLILIAFLFLFTASFTYLEFKKNLIDNEFVSQKRLALTVNQLLERYFYTLEFITKNTAIQPEFSPKNTVDDNEVLYKKIPSKETHYLISKNNIKNILISKRKSENINDINIFKEQNYYQWQIFKALPLNDNNKAIAKQRRAKAQSILDTWSDIHYVFQMNANGDLVFLSPFSVQKNISSFNYGFRDYLQLAKSNNSTSISEGYISNDSSETQIITVASPIYNNQKRITGIFAASISAKILRDKVFMALKQNMAIEDGTIFYLIDRHGHVVASSNGKNIYFPISGNKNDKNDSGNFKNLELFNQIDWYNDLFESGNVLWQRRVYSWSDSSLKDIYQKEYNNINGENVVGTFYPTNLSGYKTNWGILIETPLEQLLASENRLKWMFYFAGALLLIILLLLFLMTLSNFRKLEKKVISKEKEIEKFSSQIAHDIRSPLVALDMLVNELNNIPEQTRVTVHQAVNRINDIANKLVYKYKGKNASEMQPELAALILDNIVTEKRIEFGSKNITFNKVFLDDCYGLFVNINSTDLKRAISNLINNAVESIFEVGFVTVKLCRKLNNAEIYIIDNGCGMSESLIKSIMDAHHTSSKEHGSGLGLSFVIELFKKMNIDLSIKSEINKGTTIKISIPCCSSAAWFKSYLLIKENSKIVVLDDDQSIHGVWDQRLSEIKKETKLDILHFYSPDECLSYFENHNTDNILFLIDYELLGFKLTGIDVIEKLNIADRAILVTSHFEDQKIREKSNLLNLKSIPKNYSLYIPLKVVQVNPDCILIDDSLVVRETWAAVAKKKNISLACFDRINDFLLCCNIYDADVKIYIDSDLNDDLKGEEFAKILYQKYGFKNVYITTAYNKSRFKHKKWIKGIFGKKPPFDN